MSLSKYQIKWPIVIIVTLVVAALFIWESVNLKIETDILESIPQDDPVLSDARRVIRHLPIQDRIFIDLSASAAEKDELVDAASIICGKLLESGLFTRVGINEEAGYFPELMAHVTDNLPLLFNRERLEKEIWPLLESDRISAALRANRKSLEQLEGIGRSEMIAKDPLGFSGIILRQMSGLLPAGKVQFYRNQLISEDGKHVLITAKIAGSGTDTELAARIEKLLEDCRDVLATDKKLKNKYVLTSVGAYRAALDNETIAKRDTRLAVILTMLGIVLLLILAFPRPVIGLLALLPSTVGTIAALFVCSFFFDSISIMAVGFGGAIMAFTVDLGITYLLFLDQPYTTQGKRVAREVKFAELTAVVTTTGAFLLLLISDFKILAEIGVFAALGIMFAFAFVHIVFPRIFPDVPPAARQTNPALLSVIKIITAPARWKVIAAAFFALGMLFFAKPVFNVDLQAMNSLRPETLTAEKQMQNVWGNLSGKCYVLLEASSMEELQGKNQQLMVLLAEYVQKEKLAPVFLPAVLFPAESSARENFAAWRDFWDRDRILTLQRNIKTAAAETGFAQDAFEPFWKILSAEYPGTKKIAEKYFDLLGIAKTPEGFAQLSFIPTGKNYNAQDFFDSLALTGLVKIFDADLFNARLGDFLKNIFTEIALIVSIGLILIVFLFFLDWRLSLAVLAPVAFALVATLGTLKIIGHPLDIPGIMLWIVVMGMGIDYSIYYTCTYQRYPSEDAPAVQTIKTAIFLAAATTFIGFGVLAVAGHALLRSIGVVSLLGIGYALVGTYFILPFLMKKIFVTGFHPAGDFVIGSAGHLRRTASRYRHLPGYPRVFARMKMMIDPMFRELDHYVHNPRRIIDIGCGYGVPASWLLEIYPQAQVFGLEPDEERVLIASRVIGPRGCVQAGLAPDLPEVEGSVDYVLMLDMIHLINDADLQLVLGRAYAQLETGGTLLIRATVPSGKKIPWKRWIESLRLKFTSRPEYFRSEKSVADFMGAAGFTVSVHDPADAAIEEKWFVGKKG